MMIVEILQEEEKHFTFAEMSEKDIVGRRRNQKLCFISCDKMNV